MKNNDMLFYEREVTEKGWTVNLYPVSSKNLVAGKKSYVIPLQFGSVYVVRFSESAETVRAVAVKTLDVCEFETVESLPFGECCDFAYTPLEAGMNLVIYTEGGSFSVFENPVLLEKDTDDKWFYPPKAGHLEGGEGSWGDWHWTYSELLENVYEPLRRRFPNYITRENIGVDESGKYDMWAYTFAPEKYEKTLFITSGVHGNEFDGFLALARFIELLCNSYGSDEGLDHVRHNTRLVVIPVVDVWSTYEKKWRFNCNEKDLNRDFDSFSQRESRNVASLMKRYAEEIDVVIDLHTSGGTLEGLWYQFNIQAKNSTVTRRVINHVWHRIVEKGYETEPNLVRIPGKYVKSNQFLQGFAYNELGLANIVIEHNQSRWYPEHSAEGFYHALECYGNFIIQTALADLK